MENLLQTRIVDSLEEARKTCIPIAQLTESYPDITSKEAYEIQLEQIQRRIKQGATVVGKKIGLTSHAMQSMLGVMEPDYGQLLNEMLVYEDNEIDYSTLIQPKVEPEIAFLIAEDIKGPGITPADVMRTTFGIVPALEIIDSRIKDWKIRIEDTIADNASSALFTLGGCVTQPLGIDLRYVGMVFSKNGKIVSTASGAAVLGNPCQAVAWLANKLAEFGAYLQKGDIILSGSLVKAEPAQKGDYFSATFDRMGGVSCRFG
jgi:2-keto-4-pentenoate hydratase